MKILKYAIALFAIVAMTASVSSCSKDVDDRMADKVEAKQNFWMEFSISNPGSLPSTTVTYKKLTYSGIEYFNILFNLEIYGIENKVNELTCNPLYVTEDYARANWDKLVNLPNKDNDVIQKVMKPVAEETGVKDFEVTVVFSKDEKQTILGTMVYRAAEVLAE